MTFKTSKEGVRGVKVILAVAGSRAWSYCFNFTFSTCSKQRKCRRTTHLTTVGLSLSWRGFKVTMCHQLTGREERHIRRRQGLLLLDYWTLMMQPTPARGPGRCGQWNAGSGSPRPIRMQGGRRREEGGGRVGRGAFASREMATRWRSTLRFNEL